MHNQEYAVRVHEALRLALDRAIKKRLPLEVAKDIAQETVIAKADLLFAEDWVKVVCDHAMELVKEYVKKFNIENKAKDMMAEHIEDTMSDNIRWKGRRGGNEMSKSFIRDIAENGLWPREWQVIHGRYWNKKSFTVIAEDIGISKQAVASIHDNAIGHLRQALHKNGITKETWNKWYHERV